MRNWRIISNANEFESLVGSLLMAEMPGVVVFGRPGPDAGIDSLSADRTHVYQAKFHEDGKMSSVIASANEEIKKIIRYRQPEHHNFKYWKDITDWSLVGNFTINPNDETGWQEQVVPRFKEIGISAHFIGVEKLNGMLDRNLEIERSFFGGQIRTLIYPPEVYMRLSRTSYNGAFFASEMVGREASIGEVLKFAESSNERVLSVVGSYCCGKTRFLYESMMALGKKGWRVLWGLPESMNRSSGWFGSLQTSVKTCVFLDDPKEKSIVDSMIEQLFANERANWKLIFTCSCERARILEPEYTTNALFRSFKLPLLMREDVTKIVAQYPGLKDRPPSVDGVVEMARGMPSLACLILEFCRQNRQLALPPDSLAIMESYVTNSLKILPGELRGKACLVLRWISAWDGIVVGGDDECNRSLQYLSSLGVSCDETKTIVRELSGTGLIDTWTEYGNCCFRVQPALVRRHIIGTWLLEKNGDVYKVGNDGRKLIESLMKDGVPAADKIFQILPAVLGSYLQAEDEAEVLFHPVFQHLEERIRLGDVDEQSGIIDMLSKVGCFAPEAALELLRSVPRSLQKNGKYQDRWDVLREIAKTLAGIAEYVRERSLAVRYVYFFKEIYEATPEERGLPNGKRDEIAKAISSVINHFGELRYFPDVALSLVVERLKCGDMFTHPFEQRLAKQMLEAERENWVQYTSRAVTFHRRTIILGSREWNRAMVIREAVEKALYDQESANERETLWNLFGCGYEFVHDLCHGHANHDHQPTKDAAYKLVLRDLVFLEVALKNDAFERSVRELQLMRRVWRWEWEFGKESDSKTLAVACEDLFCAKIGFPFQYLARQYLRNHHQCVKDVADLFLRAKSADEIDSFVKRAYAYFQAEAEGPLQLAVGCPFAEVAELCCDAYDFDSTDPISEFTLRCLRRFNRAHPFFAAFAITQVGNFIRKRKSLLDQDAFAKLYGRIYHEVNDKDLFLRNLYQSGTEAFFGQMTAVEFELLLGSKMAPVDFARVLPYWLPMNPERVLDRLSDALDEERRFGGNQMVLETIVQNVYWAVDSRKTLNEELVPLEWIVEKFNEGYADASLLVDYSFKELCKLKNKKLGMLALLRFAESWIRRERAGAHAYLHDEEFEPQELFLIDDLQGFKNVCELFFIEESWFVNMHLGRIIASIDADCENVFAYVFQYVNLHPRMTVKELSCLARLVAYAKGNDKSKSVLKMICDRCELLSHDDRMHVYYHLLPSEHGASWCGDKVPDEYLDAKKAAQTLFEAEPDESSVKDFYKYCVSRASSTVDMIRTEIERWRHE